MKFKKLIASNVKGLRIVEKNEVVFDADDFYEGLILIDSPNYSGKTTLTNLCNPVPKKILSSSYDDFCDMFADEGGYIINVWEQKGDVFEFHFEIPALVKNKPRKPKAWIKVNSKVFDTAKKNEHQTIRNYEKNIYALFGIKPNILHHLILRNSKNVYTQMDSKSMNDMLTSFLDLNIVKKIGEEFGKAYTETKAYTENIQSKMDVYLNFLKNENINSVDPENYLKYYCDEEINLLAKKHEIECELLSKNNELEILQNKHIEYIRVTGGGSVYTNISTEIKKHENKIDEIKKEIARIDCAYENEDLSKKLETLRSRLSIFENEEYIEKINTKLKDNQKLKNELLELEHIKTLNKEIKGLYNQKQKTNENITYYQKQLDSDYDCVANVNCKLVEVVKQTKDKINEENLFLQNIENKIKLIQVKLNELLYKYNITIDGVDKLIKSKLDISVATGYFENIANEKKKLEENINFIANDLVKRQRKLNDIISLETEIKAKNKQYADIRDLEKTILDKYSVSQLKNKIELLKKEKSILFNNNNDIENKLIKTAEQIKNSHELIELKRLYTDAKNKELIFKEMKSAHSEKGLISYEITHQGPLLLNKGNEILENLTKQFRLEIVVQNQGKSSNFEIKAFDKLNEKMRSLDSLSGAEQIFVEYALENAFLSYLKDVYDISIETVFMDETDAPLDENNLLVAFDVLEKYRKDIGIYQIFLVSHHRKDYNENQKMRITKDGIEKF